MLFTIAGFILEVRRRGRRSHLSVSLSIIFSGLRISLMSGIAQFVCNSFDIRQIEKIQSIHITRDQYFRENGLDGKRRVWKTRSMENEEYGK